MKKSLFVEATGGPLAVVIAAATRPDPKLLAAPWDAIVVDRPARTSRSTYAWTKARTTPRAKPPWRNTTLWGTSSGSARSSWTRGASNARRWVVDRTLAWLSKCRALCDKQSSIYRALLPLACVWLWFRRWWRWSF